MIRDLMNSAAIFAAPGEPSGGGGEAEVIDHTPLGNADEFSAEEQAAFDNMQGGQPTEIPEEKPVVAAKKEEAAPKEGEEETDLEEGEEEVIIVGKDGKPRAKGGQFVPKSALLRVKEQRKAERDELASYKEKFARGDERLKTLMDVLNASPDPAGGKGPEEKNPLDEPDIDVEKDPLGAVAQANKRTAFLRKALDAQGKQSKEQQQAQESAGRERQIMDAYRTDANRFFKAEPAFKEAWEHLLTMRHAHLEIAGVSDKAARDRIIADEERNLAIESIKGNRSPAETLWKMALAAGFKKSGAAAEEPLISPAAKKLQDAAEGQARGKSLSGAGGGGPSEGLSFESIANMPEDQFLAFAETAKGAQKLRELGFEV